MKEAGKLSNEDLLVQKEGKVLTLTLSRPDALSYVTRLANGPRRAYSMIKKIANRALVIDLEAILEAERTTQAMIAQTDDHKEGVKAFKEKRLPEFTGK